MAGYFKGRKCPFHALNINCSKDTIFKNTSNLSTENMVLKKIPRIEMWIKSDIVINHRKLLMLCIPEQIGVATFFCQVSIAIVEPPIKNQDVLLYFIRYQT